MIINAQQAAEILGYKTGSAVYRLIRQGALHPTNQPKQGAQKFFAKLDSKEVHSYLKEKRNGSNLIHTITTTAAKIPVMEDTKSESNVSNGIVTRLDRIEQKLDKLLRIWN